MGWNISHSNVLERGLQDSMSLPYTSSPFQLLKYDTILFLKEILSIPFVVSPLWPFTDSSPHDELSPSLGNLYTCTLHLFLIVLQSAILISIPWALSTSMFIPLGPTLLFLALAFLVNYLVLLMLNGTQRHYKSHTGNTMQEHESEFWMFLNGVSIG